jgi:hypothetical protein
MTAGKSLTKFVSRLTGCAILHFCDQPVHLFDDYFDLPGIALLLSLLPPLAPALRICLVEADSESIDCHGTRSAIACYCNELAAAKKALSAEEPTSRIVPTTSTRITASMTAHSAMSCPASSFQIPLTNRDVHSPRSKRFTCNLSQMTLV